MTALRRHIFLTGFMGAGKTTVANHLSGRAGDAYDLDVLVEMHERLPIPVIFRERGEAGFREVESLVLRQLLALLEAAPAAVVALGGGTFAQEANRTAIREHGGVVVFLDGALPELLIRARAEGTARPLLQSDEVTSLYTERMASYSLADLVVDTSGKAAREVADEVERALLAAGILESR